MKFSPSKPFALASFIVFIFAFCSCSGSPKSKITVSNNADFERVDEIVEISPIPVQFLDSAFSYAIVDEKGKPVQFQITHDDKLIFPATVEAGGTSIYNIIKVADLSPEILKSSQADVAEPTLAYTVRPDCQDDFAWENEHSGYRLYGPSFKRGGGKVHGYDIWCKRNPQPIVDRFYNLDHGPEQISYHKDHGEGFDGYTVGPTLGAGANALMADSTLSYPTAYDAYEVLDDGPLRLTVRFTIDSIPFGQENYVTETRTISLDKNAHFNKVSTKYDGISLPTPIAAGIVVHADNPDGYALIDEANAIFVVDLSDDTSADNGEIYVGLILPGTASLQFLPFDEVKANAVGQALAISEYSPASPFTYYWGSGWSKGSVANSEAWREILIKNKKIIDNPLKTSVD